MKKKIFLFAMMLLGLVSCQTSVLDPLEGIFPAPTDVNCTIGSCDAFKENGVRYFYLEISDGSKTLDALLIGDAYYLTTNAYTPAAIGEAKKGNYVLGVTDVNNTMVESGTISVAQKDDGYRITAVLFLTDGSPYRFKWEGELYFEPDPEPVVLTQVLVAQVNTNNTVTFKLGTDDMRLDMMGSPYGPGFALTADLYSADGFLNEGVYTAAPSSDNVGPGQYTPGYPFDLSVFGMEGIVHWGTCWYAGESILDINKEPITVTKKGSKFTITWGSEETYPHWATFTGEIPELTPHGPSIDYDYTESVAPLAEGSTVMKHTIMLTEGNALVAVFELLLDEANNEIAGTYECKEYASEPGLVCNGYNFPEWGISGGSFYMKNGDRVDINAGETLEVKKLAKGAYEFVGSTGYSFSAAGPDYVPGGGGVTVYDASEVVGPVAEGSTVMKHTVTMYDGDAILAVFELLLAEGETNLVGTYDCQEYASEPGLVCNGYNFPDWGISGGSFYMKDGTRVDINAGETVTVTMEADGSLTFTGSTGYSFTCIIAVG